MLELLQFVHKEPCDTSSHQLDYTKEMKAIKTIVTAKGEDSNIQWDTFEGMTILASIMETTDNYIYYLRGIFDTGIQVYFTLENASLAVQ